MVNKGDLKAKNGVNYIEVNKLDIEKVWYENYDVIKFSQLIGKEYYYPLYQWKKFVSYSPLKLIQLKGGLDYNPKIKRYIDDDIDNFTFLPPEVSIDKNIKRIGGLLKPSKSKIKIEETDSFIHYFTEAIIKDIRNLELLHEKAIFGILTGGKDSLNLLLLPWKNPIVALSAEPNYTLVKQFCIDNQLDIEVIKLRGEESDTRERSETDILSNCCRVNLGDIRWTQELAFLKEKIKTKNDKELVILSGDLADAFLTPKHLHFKSKWNSSLFDKVRNKFENHSKMLLESIWYYGAQYQSIYHGILRESTGIRNYGAYQGENTMLVLSKTNFKKVVQEDIREKIGHYIFKEKVIYPSKNPSPIRFLKRIKINSVNVFLELVNNHF